MRWKAIVASLFLSGFLVAAGAGAQHHGHPAPGSKPDAAASAAAHHQQMQALAEDLLESLAALELEGEQGPETLKKNLAEHRVLLAQLQSKIRQCSEMTPKAGKRAKGCCMMGSEHKH